MGVNESGKRADVDEDLYQGVVVVVGTTQVEAKVGAAREPARQLVLLYNDSVHDVFYGPNGVSTSGSNKGIPLVPGQEAAVPAGNIGLYLISAFAGCNVIVQELG